MHHAPVMHQYALQTLLGKRKETAYFTEMQILGIQVQGYELGLVIVNYHHSK